MQCEASIPTTPSFFLLPEMIPAPKVSVCSRVPFIILIYLFIYIYIYMYIYTLT
jgi:hypothetical protein